MPNNGLWIWGYVLPEVPGPMMFIPGETRCSIETAAAYMGADNIVFMDSTTKVENLNDTLFSHVSGFKQVLCGLAHGNYAEAALAVSKFSLTHQNVTGAIIDDFLDSVGPSQTMTPDKLKEIYCNLKSCNPALKLYVVRYSRQDMAEIDPYLQYIDGINYWVWVSTEHYWRYQYHEDILRLNQRTGKEILQGVFLHDYGFSGQMQPMKMLKRQLPLIGGEMKEKMLSGIVLLQNGWFDRESHRKAIQYTHDYCAWFYGTQTLR